MALGWFKKKDGKSSALPSGPKVPTLSPPSKGVRVGDLLTEESIVVFPAGQSKDQVLSVLVERLCRQSKLGDAARFLEKVLEREQGISTTLDTGLAVPHARVEGLDSIAAILGVLQQGFEDPKQPDLVIRAVFLFFSPARQELFTRHLHLLRGASALFQPALLEEAARCSSPAEVLKLIKSKEKP